MIKFPEPVRRAWKRANKRLREGIVSRSPDWVHRRFGTAGAYLDMFFVDHGMFRYVYVNQHALAKDAWRSAQPAPRHIRRLARKGIKTIVNLRGERLCGSYYLERRTCAELGIRLVNFQIRSRAAPTREEIRAARDLIGKVEYPILLHCKSGADRAGLMSVLFRHVKNGEPIEIAKKELAAKYGHFRQADTGILDYFFERYLEDNAERPMPFFEWVETIYDPVELKRSFKASGWANRIVNNVLRRE
jgi:protein tyrosine/serine phosphatase